MNGRDICIELHQICYASQPCIIISCHSPTCHSQVDLLVAQVGGSSRKRAGREKKKEKEKKLPRGKGRRRGRRRRRWENAGAREREREREREYRETESNHHGYSCKSTRKVFCFKEEEKKEEKNFFPLPRRLPLPTFFPSFSTKRYIFRSL